MNIPSTGFVQIVRTGRSNIGNSGCHRRRNAQPLTGGHRGTAAEPHQNTGGTGAHQVLRLGVPCHAADHNRHIQLVNEFLEVQRFMRGRNMLRRDRSTANHEKIGTGLHHRFVMFLGVLRGKRARHNNTRITNFFQTRGNQLGLNRLSVNLLHARGSRGRISFGKLSNFVKKRLRILIASPQAF